MSFDRILRLGILTAAMALYALPAAAETIPVKGTGCQEMGESLSLAAARKMAKDKAVKNAIESVMVSSKSLLVDVSGQESKEEYQSVFRIIETTVAGRIGNSKFSDYYENPKNTQCIDVGGTVDMEELRGLVNAIEGVDPEFDRQVKEKAEQFSRADARKTGKELNEAKLALLSFLLKKPVIQIAYGESAGSDTKTPKQTKAEAEEKSVALARKIALNRMFARLTSLPSGFLAIPYQQAKNVMDGGLRLANKALLDAGGNVASEPMWDNSRGTGGAKAIVKAAFTYQGPMDAFIKGDGGQTVQLRGPDMKGKPLVLMALKVNGQITLDDRRSFLRGLAEELAKTYQLSSGKKVDQAADKAIENYDARECVDEPKCIADVAGKFDAQFAALPEVAKSVHGDYTVGLRIYDISADEDIYEGETECRGCGHEEAAAKLRELAAESAAPKQAADKE